jgi:glycosyltransferase involved in cell wall biosynthesis
LRVLVVLPFPPLAEGGAAARCAIGLLRGLQAHGVDFRALGITMRDLPPGGVPDDLPIEVLQLPPLSRAHQRWLRFTKPHRMLEATAFVGRTQELARDADLVHFVELDSASLAAFVDRPALAQLHCLTRLDRDIPSRVRRQGRVAHELLRAERRVFQRATWLLANSREVADAMVPLAPQAQVAVGPLALDPAGYAPRATLEAPVAGLIGTAIWPPTANAVERLLTRVWPLVLERRPDARLLLAGFGMRREAFPHLPDLPGVEWRGQVPSATDFLRELGVLLYPLGRGSGAKIKVLEALALGVPVVTTGDGAEGIGGRGGIAVGEDDAAIADATATLLGDVAVRQAAGDAAYATFCEHHAPAPAAVPVIELYERMLGGVAARSVALA